jgi:hypothetical protein
LMRMDPLQNLVQIHGQQPTGDTMSSLSASSMRPHKRDMEESSVMIQSK